MITVHHLNNSRSQRVLWLFEELGLPYEVKRYDRDPKTMRAPAALKAVHPLGKSPVVGEDGVIYAESGAIIEHFAEAAGGGALAPDPGTPEHRKYLYFLHYAEGSLMPPLLMKLVFGAIPPRVPFFIRPVARMIAAGARKSFIDPELEAHLDFLESTLAKTPWFAGERFSAADITMSFPIEAAFARGGLSASRPQLSRWLRTIQARPAYRRALERGGPYTL